MVVALGDKVVEWRWRALFKRGVDNDELDFHFVGNDTFYVHRNAVAYGDIIEKVIVVAQLGKACLRGVGAYDIYGTL